MEVKFLSIVAFGRQYGISRSSVYELLAQNKIRAVKLGKKTLIDVAAADAMFAGLPAAKINCGRARPSAS
jgi:excisionase family DNA binding protein